MTTKTTTICTLVSGLERKIRGKKAEIELLNIELYNAQEALLTLEDELKKHSCLDHLTPKNLVHEGSPNCHQMDILVEATIIAHKPDQLYILPTKVQQQQQQQEEEAKQVSESLSLLPEQENQEELAAQQLPDTINSDNEFSSMESFSIPESFADFAKETNNDETNDNDNMETNNNETNNDINGNENEHFYGRPDFDQVDEDETQLDLPLNIEETNKPEEGIVEEGVVEEEAPKIQSHSQPQNESEKQVEVLVEESIQNLIPQLDQSYNESEQEEQEQQLSQDKIQVNEVENQLNQFEKEKLQEDVQSLIIETQFVDNDYFEDIPNRKRKIHELESRESDESDENEDFSDSSSSSSFSPNSEKGEEEEQQQKNQQQQETFVIPKRKWKRSRQTKRLRRLLSNGDELKAFMTKLLQQKEQKNFARFSTIEETVLAGREWLNQFICAN